MIACEDRLSGELLHYTAVYFVVDKNDANSFSMRLQVIGGDDHLLEGYLLKISEDGIWEAKKSRLLHEARSLRNRAGIGKRSSADCTRTANQASIRSPLRLRF